MVDGTELWLIPRVHVAGIVEEVRIKATVEVGFGEIRGLVEARICLIKKHRKVVTAIEERGPGTAGLERLPIEGLVDEAMVVTEAHDRIGVQDIIYTTISNSYSLNISSFTQMARSYHKIGKGFRVGSQSFCQHRYVRPAITLPHYVELVALSFWELLEFILSIIYQYAVGRVGINLSRSDKI